MKFHQLKPLLVAVMASAFCSSVYAESKGPLTIENITTGWHFVMGQVANTELLVKAYSDVVDGASACGNAAGDDSYAVLSSDPQLIDADRKKALRQALYLALATGREVTLTFSGCTSIFTYPRPNIVGVTLH